MCVNKKEVQTTQPWTICRARSSVVNSIVYSPQDYKLLPSSREPFSNSFPMKRNTNQNMYGVMNHPNLGKSVLTIPAADFSIRPDGSVNVLSCGSICSVLGFAIVPLIIWYLLFQMNYECRMEYHGGSPVQNGNCFCSKVDDYCLCTPTIRVEGILEYRAPGAGTAHTDPDCLNCQLIARETIVFPRDPDHSLPDNYLFVGLTAEDALQYDLRKFNNITFHHAEHFHLYSELYPNHITNYVIHGQVNTVDFKQEGRRGNIVTPFLKDIFTFNFSKQQKKVLYDYIKRRYPKLLKHMKRIPHPTELAM